MSTFLAVLGCVAIVGLLELLSWVRREEESAKRILQLEVLYRVKCKETDAMNWEINAGRAAAFELSQMLSEVVQGMDGSRGKNLFAPVTFQPDRPKEQPQKPSCDN